MPCADSRYPECRILLTIMLCRFVVNLRQAQQSVTIYLAIMAMAKHEATTTDFKS